MRIHNGKNLIIEKNKSFKIFKNQVKSLSMQKDQNIN
jgi:hypothetical protein